MHSNDFWTAFLDAHVRWLGYGFSGFGGWQILAYTLVTTHITTVAVTVYLHRSQAHRSLELHPALSHLFRLWLWLGTGVDTKQWVAVHRKHHARCETDEDPHSPHTHGIKAVLLTGAELYSAEARRSGTVKRFGRGTPNDWLETNLYSRYSWQGVGLTLILELFLFGAAGAAVWAVQIMWIPVTGAGIVNGIGHWCGYRNFESPDESHNFMPWGLIIGGEELHNNHHTYPSSAKFSCRRFELDIGWMYICGLRIFGLVTVHKTFPRLTYALPQRPTDAATLQAVVVNRFELMARYATQVRAEAVAELRGLTANGADDSSRSVLLLAKPWLHRDGEKIPVRERPHVAHALAISPRLAIMVEMRERLRHLWNSTHGSVEQLTVELQTWLRDAERSEVRSLREFAVRLRSVQG